MRKPHLVLKAQCNVFQKARAILRHFVMSEGALVPCCFLIADWLSNRAWLLSLSLGEKT